MRLKLIRQSALRFAVVPDTLGMQALCPHGLVSILFEVRGGSRHEIEGVEYVWTVSIRFKVRGGFRRVLLYITTVATQFQSALRFAVVPDTF